jgi:hypothetical protein
MPEAVTITSKETSTIQAGLVPFEMLMLPNWMDTETYHPAAISDKFYEPMLGCRAISDPGVLGMAATSSVEAANLENSELKTFSLEQALDVLTVLYGLHLSREDLDIDVLTRSVTRRPIASKNDILGRDGLTYELEGDTLYVVQGEKRYPAPETGKALSSGDQDSDTFKALELEGFHSRSVNASLSALGNLRGLVAPSDVIDSDSQEHRGSKNVKLPGNLDPRKAKLDRVKEYKKQLVLDKGELSKGLKG